MAPHIRASLAVIFLSFALTAGVTYNQTVRTAALDGRVPVKSRVIGIEPPVFDIPLKLYSPPFTKGPVFTAKIVVAGDRLASVGKDVTRVFDLKAHTITMILPKKHSYTLETFAEAEQHRREMIERWTSLRTTETYVAAVQKTGGTKQIVSQTAEEYRVIAIGLLHGKRRVAASSIYWVLPNAPRKELTDFQLKWARETRLPFPGMPSVDDSLAYGAMARAAAKLPGFTVAYIIESRPLPEASRKAPPADYDASTPEIARPSPGVVSGLLDYQFSRIRASETSFSSFATEPEDASVFSIPTGFKERKGAAYIP